MLGQPPPPPAFGRGHVVLFLKGAAITLFVSTLAMALAIAARPRCSSLARLYGGPRRRARSPSAYVEVFRGTPVLLQLYLLYYGLAPVLKLGALTAAVIGLGMNYAAYEAEVYRAGIQAVPRGADGGGAGARHVDAARAPARASCRRRCASRSRT